MAVFNGKDRVISPEIDEVVAKLIELRNSLCQVSLLLKDLRSNLDIIEHGEATILTRTLMFRLMNTENRFASLDDGGERPHLT
jgi:hypothetical protein